MKLSIEEIMQKVEALKARETVLIDDVPVRVAWVDSDNSFVPCDICKNTCRLSFNRKTICLLLDEPRKRYAYLVLDEKELADSSYHGEL